ncbi:hypothetical protein D3C80_1892380 [compost metagenome]
MLNDTDAFMAEDHPGLVTEIAVLDVQVGVANAAALHFQQRFTVFERAQGFVHDLDATPLGNNSSFHTCLRVMLSELELLQGQHSQYP